ncbi:HD domain-containing protein [Mesorhizobium sp. L-8-10]|uniref:HD domain-containing protein n=1 Tax=Mesorhizobium sp. L-8-10 TaxID=2744523 RepID=UPI0019274355|nr:HD domain-containing protein [Mesorhizobium sp. L-8-10]
MSEDYIDFHFGGYDLSLHLPTTKLKSYHHPSNPKDVAAAFTPEGIQPPYEVKLVADALLCAAEEHGKINHRRKYTDEPYVLHPIAVAKIVMTVAHTPEMVAAALLHDVVEDTPEIGLHHIFVRFGDEVSVLVDWLTDVSKPSDGNRSVRKEIDRQHIAKAPPAAKTIKLADLIDNTLTIKERDPDFWRVYRHEKLRLLEVLKEGDQTLWNRAMEQCK